MGYTDVKSLLIFTGLTPFDLGFTEEDLSEDSEKEYSKEEWDKVKDYLEEVSDGIEDLINQYIGKEYSNNAPLGLVKISDRLCANFISNAIQYRQTGMSQYENIATAIIESNVLTDSVERELNHYKAKPTIRFGVLGR